jgi:tetratricopeptide (TPR) repeat protein
LRARAEETLAILEAKESGEINLMRLRLAARIGPPDWQIEQTYIKALANAGLTARAITELKSCLVIAPYRSESWLLISRLLRRIGRPDESAIAFARARATDVHLRDRLAFRASRGEPEIF